MNRSIHALLVLPVIKVMSIAKVTRMKLLLATVLFGLVSATTASEAAMPVPVVRAFRVVSYEGTIGIEITTDREIVFTCTKMPALLRFVIDLHRTDPGRNDTVYKVYADKISTIRLEKRTINDEPVTRITVNLTDDMDFTTRIDPANRKRVTILLHTPSGGTKGLPH